MGRRAEPTTTVTTDPKKALASLSDEDIAAELERRSLLRIQGAIAALETCTLKEAIQACREVKKFRLVPELLKLFAPVERLPPPPSPTPKDPAFLAAKLPASEEAEATEKKVSPKRPMRVSSFTPLPPRE